MLVQFTLLGKKFSGSITGFWKMFFLITAIQENHTKIDMYRVVNSISFDCNERKIFTAATMSFRGRVKTGESFFILKSF